MPPHAPTPSTNQPNTPAHTNHNRTMPPQHQNAAQRDGSAEARDALQRGAGHMRAAQSLRGGASWQANQAKKSDLSLPPPKSDMRAGPPPTLTLQAPATAADSSNPKLTHIPHTQHTSNTHARARHTRARAPAASRRAHACRPLHAQNLKMVYMIFWGGRRRRRRWWWEAGRGGKHGLGGR
jgi:hypothetical protein